VRLRVFTLPGLAAFQRLKLFISTSLLGSYMRKTNQNPGRFNIGCARMLYNLTLHCLVSKQKQLMLMYLKCRGADWFGS